MRKTITSIIFIIISTVCVAQSSGIITYKEVINTKPDMAKAEEQGWAQWAEMMPESMSFKKQLVYNDSISMYINVKEEEEDPNETNMMKRMMRRYSNSDNQTYRNSSNGTFVEHEDFMGKSFIIKGKPETIKWKMTGEMKVIMNYPCLKATYQDSTETLEAWFTTEIPVSIGPEKYGDLPGMILELTSKKRKKTLTAINIEFKTVDEAELKEPKEGKVVTREEYHKIVRQKMKEMRESRGGVGKGGHRR
jgi:GLPGLI family protein